MNKKIVTLMIVLTFPLTAVALPGGGGDGGRFEGHRNDNMEQLANKLDLNDEQKRKLGVIFKEQRVKIDAIRQESRARMQEILSSEQMDKLDEFKNRRHEKWQKRHEGWKNKNQSENQM